MSNILGEDFSPFVQKQIEVRQKVQFSGLNSKRENKDILYLNNRNAFLKLASSVSIKEDKLGEERLQNIGLSQNDFKGKLLAQKSVLFNTLSEVIPTTYKQNEEGETEADINGSYSFREGISKSNSLWNNSSYGLGGTNFGLTPPPGLISATVQCVNRGSIRKASVKIKAYNKFQFDLIEMLYLRLGYTMMLEWGWDKYLDENGVLQNTTNTLIEDFWFQNNNTSQLEVLKKIQEYRRKFDGNYDGFFGKVNNFSWQFDQEGNYNITLDLITVGDIIESLQANSPAVFTPSEKEKDKEGNEIENPLQVIETAASQTSMGIWLYNLIVDYDSYIEFNKEYKDVVKIPKSITSNSSPPTEGMQYYVTFGVLLEFVERQLLPTIDNGGNSQKILSVDTERGSNWMNYYTNQISLDPRVCMIKPIIDANSPIFEDDISGPKTNISSDVKFYFTPKSFKDFTNKQYFRYGDIMNVYLNFDFIAKSLNSNVDKEGKLSVYKFLEKICDGINSSLGNVNQLEPVIKEDSIITIIDQSAALGLTKNDTIPTIEVFGYNISGSSSNFAKSIDFTTKLDPKTSTMITIGAGGGKNSQQIIDGTSFSKWSVGLEDRFSQKILQPKKIQTSPTKYKQEEEKLRIELGKEWDKAERDFYSANNFFNDFRSEENQVAEVKKLIKWNGREYKNQTREGFINNVIKDRNAKKDAENSLPPLSDAQKYGMYLRKCFSNDGIKSSSPYFGMEGDFVKEGKATFKNYIIDKNNTKFEKNQNSSNQIGFIPMGFNLTLDGISGIKIYQQLRIQQQFLPANYPTAFKFLVTQVNHDINNNSWDTKITTTSTSNIEDNVEDEISKDYPNYALAPQDDLSDKKRFPIDSLSISDNGIRFIKRSEGFRVSAYDDFNPNQRLNSNTPIEGTLTIGYGFTQAVISNLKWDSTITENEADRLFREKITIYENIVKRSITSPLTQSEYDSLVSIAYNAGSIGNVSYGMKTPLRNSLNNQEYVRASNIIPQYRITSKGNILPGLIKRRKEEQILFLS